MIFRFLVGGGGSVYSASSCCFTLAAPLSALFLLAGNNFAFRGACLALLGSLFGAIATALGLLDEVAKSMGDRGLSGR